MNFPKVFPWPLLFGEAAGALVEEAFVDDAFVEDALAEDEDGCSCVCDGDPVGCVALKATVCRDPLAMIDAVDAERLEPLSDAVNCVEPDELFPSAAAGVVG